MYQPRIDQDFDVMEYMFGVAAEIGNIRERLGVIDSEDVTYKVDKEIQEIIIELDQIDNSLSYVSEELYTIKRCTR